MANPLSKLLFLPAAALVRPAAAHAAATADYAEAEARGTEPRMSERNERVAVEVARVLATYRRSGRHLGNPAEHVTLRSCLARQPFSVVLDPGHDPEDHRGARLEDGLLEWELNYALAEKLQKKIQAAARIKVDLSREREEALPIRDRIAKINLMRPDLVISLHHDNVQKKRRTRRTVRGGSLWTCDDHEGFAIFASRTHASAEMNQRVARFISDTLKAAGRPVGRFYQWGDNERGIHGGGGLGLLRGLRPPAVLLEVGFVCNLRDRRLVTSRRFVDRQAALLADAIRRYVLAYHCVVPQETGYKRTNVWDPG